MGRMIDGNTKQCLRGIPILDVADRLGIEVNHRTKMAKCFAHDDKTPSLSFNVTNGNNYFYCFGCGIGSKEQGTSSDTIALVQVYLHCDFNEACEWLASQFNVTIGYESHATPITYSNPNYHRKNPYEAVQEPTRLDNMLSYNLPHTEIYDALYNLSDDPDDRLKAWWHNRGFDDDLLEQYGWRIVSPRTLEKLAQMVDYATLAQAGLVGAENGQKRQLFGKYTYNNVIVPFYGSVMDGRPLIYVRFRDITLNANAKYIAPSQTSYPIFGYDQLTKWAGLVTKEQPPLYVTGSETDAIAITQLAKLKGKKAYVVALCGEKKTEATPVVRELVQVIKTYKQFGATMNICTDNDKTGNEFYKNMAKTLYQTGLKPQNLIKWQPWLPKYPHNKDVNGFLQIIRGIKVN